MSLVNEGFDCDGGERRFLALQITHPRETKSLDQTKMSNWYLKSQLEAEAACSKKKLTAEEDVSLSNESTTVEARGKWNGKLDFIFGCISYAVGLGNVWRFPYLCYENGGGAFLIPYFICLVFAAIPMFFMEVAMGQYLSAGGTGIWKSVPMFKGVGIASLIIVSLSNIYYMVLVAWIMYYLIMSFRVDLPWKSCGQDWNTERCREHQGNDEHRNDSTSPVVEFWERRVLGITDGLHEMGDVQWENLLCLFVCWVLVYFVIYRGLNRSGKIVWVTAIFPYICLFSLLIRGLTLDGCMEGLKFYVTPDWNSLTKPKVWVAAGTQVFYTFGIGVGSVVTLGSYNNFHQNFFRDCTVICILNPLTSLLAGTVIFSVLGHMAFEAGKSVSEVVNSGPGLAFLVYPEAVLQMPGSSAWSVLFFMMLLCLGINSQFCPSEAIVAGITDEWPNLLKKRKLITFCMILFQFIVGIPMVFQGGMYILHLFDNYAVTGITLLFVVFFQCIALSWIYGVDRISDNIEDMIGRRPNALFCFCWTVSIPAMCVGIFVFNIVAKAPLVYGKGYEYPWWGETIGWGLALISMSAIPIYAIYFLATDSGSFMQRLRNGCRPMSESTNCSHSDLSGTQKKYTFSSRTLP